jgi:AraC family transcriptional regulator, regulatory protein of adaptative response / methylated-DNA-[protein]-cysteine methyltransferase
VTLTVQASVKDYRRIEKAIYFLERNFHRHPDLKEIARSVHLSEYHFQRLFKRWAGISPKRFLQLLIVEYAKNVMTDSTSLLDLTDKTGLSSAGRLHDLFVNIEAMTPGEFRKRGEHVRIFYGFHMSPFGDCFVAITGRGICNLAFVGRSNKKMIVDNLLKQWRSADISEDRSRTQPYVDRIFNSRQLKSALPVQLLGTNFQISVWRALLKIPHGKIVSYTDIAGIIGKPEAVRAVSSAVACNPIAYLIPCHRVIRKTGALGGYRWGITRKKAMLAWEAANEEQGIIKRENIDAF